MIPFAPEDDWLLSLPLFHVSGQGILWRWLLAGARLTVSERSGRGFAGCTHASLVPTQLWRLLNDAVEVSLKAVLLGGAAIPVDLTEHARERGIRTWCGYGLTEFASTVCGKEADGQSDVGCLLPGRALRIVDDEVWLRAESMASGYWRDGELLPLLNDEGWFATRDKGVLHDGRLTILGRLDNLFFSGGEGIQPEEVERVIVAHPQVQQVLLFPAKTANLVTDLWRWWSAMTPLSSRSSPPGYRTSLRASSSPLRGCACRRIFRPAALKYHAVRYSHGSLNGRFFA
jgi:O-succinylbenzoic acid--CoA ligase